MSEELVRSEPAAPSPSLADEPANRQASAFDVAGLAERLGEAAEWLSDGLPEDIREIQHLEGDVSLDELDLYCVNLMHEAADVLAAPRYRPDYYPSHEALVELVFLLNSRPHVNDHAFTERWERAVAEAEELVRVEP